jgi:glycogen(starch) synthase
MRILLLSWEYPPRIVGGLGRHVDRLSFALAAEGHEVHVISRDHPDAPAEETIDGVHVVRTAEHPPRVDMSSALVPWVLQFNLAVQERALGLLAETEVDVIHAHDWLVAYAAVGAKAAHDLPLVATVHATEYGRHQGWLPGPMNRLIHQIEWWLTYEARRVITCSHFMADQSREIFQLPADKIDVIPNGVDLADHDRPEGLQELHDLRAQPGEKLIFFAGRLEYEKGVQTVLDALPILLRKQPVRFYVAGVGTHEEELKAHAARLGLSDRVHFLGFVDDDELRTFYRAADLGVVPSIYEPFGMVAIETMASGTPCIAADTGGLRELVVHDATGLRFRPEDPVQLAEMILQLTTDRRLAKRLTVDARRMITERFGWESIARATVATYEQAIDEERAPHGRDDRPPLRAILGRSPLLAEA